MNKYFSKGAVRETTSADGVSAAFERKVIELRRATVFEATTARGWESGHDDLALRINEGGASASAAAGARPKRAASFCDCSTMGVALLK